MKCNNCKEDIEKGDDYHNYCGKVYCYDCMYDYVNDDNDTIALAIELWIEHNTETRRKS